MTTQINVVVTCAKRKMVRPAPELTAATLPPGPVDKRVREWVRRVDRVPAIAVAARDLYAGNHWHIVRNLRPAAAGGRIQLAVWIASAGYGLVPIDVPLKPYSATLTRGRDSVGTGDEAVEWWRLLSTWVGPAAGHPRSIAALARQQPNAVLLIAASAGYIGALEQDIAEAASTLGRRRIAIISAGLNGHSSLSEYVVPCDARSGHVVGGSMQSLNARLLRLAISLANRWLPNTDALKALFEERLGDLPPMRKYDRTPLSDAEVRDYIRQELKSTPAAGHTTLLRRLRESNRACEQARFKQLYTDVRGEGT